MISVRGCSAVRPEELCLMLDTRGGVEGECRGNLSPWYHAVVETGVQRSEPLQKRSLLESNILVQEQAMKMAAWAMFYKEAMAAKRSEAGTELGKVNWERRIWSLGGRTCGIWVKSDVGCGREQSRVTQWTMVLWRGPQCLRRGFRWRIRVVVGVWVWAAQSRCSGAPSFRLSTGRMGQT